MRLFIYFLWPPYYPALVNGGSRKFYTWWTLSVIREVSSWIFFLITLKLQGGRKSDEIRRICRPHPQTFCSHARTRQNIVIWKKLVKHRWLLYSNATFSELWPTNPWDPRDTKFLKNDTRGSEVTQGHWKWYHLKVLVRFPNFSYPNPNPNLNPNPRVRGQGHWKLRRSIDHMRLSIGPPL